MKKREADLGPPTIEWLRSEGFVDIYQEVDAWVAAYFGRVAYSVALDAREESTDVPLTVGHGWPTVSPASGDEPPGRMNIMSVTMEITNDPTGYTVPRTEKVATVDVAAVDIIRWQRSGIIRSTANSPVVGTPARTVRFVAGVCCEGARLEEVAVWQADADLAARRAEREHGPSPADMSDSLLQR